MIQYTSYFTCQSIAPKIMQDLGYGSIGFINLAIIYLSWSIFSLFSVPVTNALGFRTSLFLSSAFYALWAFIFILPAYKHQLGGTTQIA